MLALTLLLLFYQLIANYTAPSSKLLVHKLTVLAESVAFMACVVPRQLPYKALLAWGNQNHHTTGSAAYTKPSAVGG